MRFPIGAMTVGDILDRAIKLLFGRLGTYYTIMLVTQIPALAMQLAVVFARPGQLNPGDSRALMMLAIVGLVGVVVAVIMQQIGNAAILHVISQEFIDKPASVGEAFNFAVGVFGRLFVVSLLSGLIIGVGLILCIIPGILFAIWYVFAAQVAVVEGKGSSDALSRSKSLTEGQVGRIIGIGAIIFVIAFGVGMINAGLEIVLPSQELVPGQFGGTMILNKTNHILHLLVTFVLNVFVSSFAAICITLLYFDIRIRKEGFDLETIARQQAEGGARPTS